MKKSLILFALLIIIFQSCDPFNNIIEKESETDAAKYYTSNSLTDITDDNDTLIIASWNIKFGGGRIDFFFDCYGNNVLMKKDDVISNLKGIYNKITQIDPDIIFLQEIDIDSKRSGYIDQLQWLLDRTQLNYAYYGSQWKSDFVPSDGIGRMNSGSAILSKYPLKDAKRIPLPLIDEQSGIEQYFYLRRNILRATTTVNGNNIVLLTTHTSAYSKDNTRLIQLEQIKKEVDKINSNGQKFIIGGDFNTLPPNTIVYENFDDGACNDDPNFATQSFINELDYMNMFIDSYQPAISQNNYEIDNSLYYSFTSDKDGFWNRKLDYIYTNGNFVDNSGLVHQDFSSGSMETMPLSDHAPVTVSYINKHN